MTDLDVVDLLVEAITVDAYDVAEQMTAFHSVFTEAVTGFLRFVHRTCSSWSGLPTLGSRQEGKFRPRSPVRSKLRL